MPILSKEHRNLLSRVTLKARERAEAACRAALENLAVHEKDYRGHMSVAQRQLRNRLRARGRALGNERDERTGAQDIRHLTEHAAFEHWHRLLFTRFLAENNLLRTDAANGNVSVTLHECEELAPELGARGGFDLACRFASQTLPGVFRVDDPVLELRLAGNDEVELRRLLDSLPGVIFQSDDALGWTYQFWQAQNKDEVNASGKKIGADELAPVTQLFTEDYMVEFLLHNTLGAWWAGKLGPIHAETEAEARAKAGLLDKEGIAITWTYLRLIQDKKTRTWSPASSAFEGWPKIAREITFLDPCMGSGHFPVFALPILSRLRMEEEQLTAAVAVAAVLRDNLHGLELDPRCTQIAAFNVALTAWKLGGWQTLPMLHLACCGIAPQAKLENWLHLAGNSDRLRRGMANLFELFAQAPIIGSLINPRLGGDMFVAEFHELAPLLERAMVAERPDDGARELAVAAQGIAKAAEILAGQFTLVATNVPYLGRGKQDDVLKDYCERVHPVAKADLSTCFVERCINFCSFAGTTSLVTPHSWLFLGTYKRLRKELLVNSQWNAISRLGPGAFGTIGGEVVNVALVQITNCAPAKAQAIMSVDVSSSDSPWTKAEHLQRDEPRVLVQQNQLTNPDSCIQTEERTNDLPLLKDYADVYQGVGTTDNPQYLLMFWEVPEITKNWDCFQYSPEIDGTFSGCSGILKWEQGRGPLSAIGTAHKGLKAFGEQGFAVSVTSGQKFTRFLGYRFDNTIAVLLPRKPQFHNAVGAFLISDEFKVEVRKLDQALSVTESSFLKVPFDLAHWQKVAAKKYPHGLPKPYSSDPTQWLFNGHPKGADQPLHVAVARLLSYRWPRQTGSSFPDCPALGPDGLDKVADEDGIVSLPPLNREQPGAARLRQLLTAALGAFDERALLAAAGASSKNIEDWLRDEFFEQHCALFHHRPFIWHVWDGRKDGFHALVNYHNLDRDTLQKLTYSYLGDWIHKQEDEVKADAPGAAERLGAARALQAELAKILEGEAPLDIFVRWKPVKEQAIGWQPDLNDGVRLNIRPFLQAKDVGKKGAGLLRSKPNIKWDKDRGTEPERPKKDYPWFWCESEPDTDPAGSKSFAGSRWNNVHFSLAAKREARRAK